MTLDRVRKIFSNRTVATAVTLFLLFCFSVFVVYWVRVFYYFDFTTAPIMIAVTFPLAVLCYYMLYFAAKGTVKNFALWGAVLVGFCGIVYSFANAPLQVPDETAHFLRSYAMAGGDFDFDPAREYPDDVGLLLQEFEPFYSHYHQEEKDQIIYRYESYFDSLTNGDTAETEEPIMMLILPFIPSTLVMAPLRLLGANALVCLFAARIANVAIFALISYYALCITKRFRVLFLAFMLLPTTMFMAASCSYDSSMLALSILLFAYVFKEKITTRDIVVICLLVFYISHIKILNIFLVVPLFAIGKTQWVSRVSKFFFILLISAAGILSSVFVSVYSSLFSSFEPIARLDSVDPTQQLLFILSNIPRYIFVMFGSFYENGFYVTQLGIFGWMDTVVPLVSYLSLPILVGIAIFSSQRNSGDVKLFTLLCLFTVGYAVCAISGLYLTNTPVAMVRVVGVQPRYFLPSIYSLCLAIGIFCGRYIEIKSRFTECVGVIIAGGFSLLSALMLFLAHNVIW